MPKDREFEEEEIRQLREDFENNQAEEHVLLEEFKKEKKMTKDLGPAAESNKEQLSPLEALRARVRRMAADVEEVKKNNDLYKIVTDPELVKKHLKEMDQLEEEEDNG